MISVVCDSLVYVETNEEAQFSVEIVCSEYEPTGRRYACDATDEEWSHIAPLLPPVKLGGIPRTTVVHDVFGAILYMAPGAVSGVYCGRLSVGLGGLPVS